MLAIDTNYTAQTTQDLLFKDNKSTILMDLASAASNPFRKLEGGVLRFLAARVIIFAIAYFYSYGVLNLLAFAYLYNCEVQALQNESIPSPIIDPISPYDDRCDEYL